MRATLLILLSSVSYVQASVVVTSVNIEASVSSSNGYGYYEANTISDWHQFEFSDSKSFIIDTPVTTTQSIATSSTPEDLVVPAGYVLLNPQNARANAGVDLHIDRGVSFIAQAGTNISYGGAIDNAPIDASASMTIEIAFQVFNAPALFSYYEPLQVDWRQGGLPHADFYELEDTECGSVLFNTFSSGNPVTQVTNFTLQPGEYLFKASLNPLLIQQIYQTFSGSAEGRLTIVPEVSSELLVATAMLLVVLVGRRKRCVSSPQSRVAI